jgi:hypothetical protein
MKMRKAKKKRLSNNKPKIIGKFGKINTKK